MLLSVLKKVKGVSMSDFKHTINYILETKKCSRKELAEEWGCGVSFLSAMECGKKLIPSPIAEAMIKVFENDEIELKLFYFLYGRSLLEKYSEVQRKAIFSYAR